jgi:hypothetical protein
MRRKFVRAGVCLFALMLQACASKRDAPLTGFEADFENEAKPWQELQTEIPPYPNPANLLRIPTGTATPHQFFIDSASVSVGEDGVTRYTVVTRAAGGATNVTYEGLRCETRERKVYAFGHPNGTWVRARNAQWQRVVLRDLTPYSHTLYTQFFCNERTRPTPPRIALDALRQGRGLNPGAGSDD